jgi:hypothetical protein
MEIMIIGSQDIPVRISCDVDMSSSVPKKITQHSQSRHIFFNSRSVKFQIFDPKSVLLRSVKIVHKRQYTVEKWYTYGTPNGGRIWASMYGTFNMKCVPSYGALCGHNTDQKRARFNRPGYWQSPNMYVYDSQLSKNQRLSGFSYDDRE